MHLVFLTCLTSSTPRLSVTDEVRLRARLRADGRRAEHQSRNCDCVTYGVWAPATLQHRRQIAPCWRMAARPRQLLSSHLTANLAALSPVRDAHEARTIGHVKQVPLEARELAKMAQTFAVVP